MTRAPQCKSFCCVAQCCGPCALLRDALAYRLICPGTCRSFAWFQRHSSQSRYFQGIIPVTRETSLCLYEQPRSFKTMPPRGIQPTDEAIGIRHTSHAHQRPRVANKISTRKRARQVGILSQCRREAAACSTTRRQCQTRPSPCSSSATRRTREVLRRAATYAGCRKKHNMSTDTPTDVSVDTDGGGRRVRVGTCGGTISDGKKTTHESTKR